MKKLYTLYSSTYITSSSVFFITFQAFYLTLIQPIKLNAQTRICEYISPIGVKRFTRKEQRCHGFRSNHHLCCAKVQDYRLIILIQM